MAPETTGGEQTTIADLLIFEVTLLPRELLHEQAVRGEYDGAAGAEARHLDPPAAEERDHALGPREGRELRQQPCAAHPCRVVGGTCRRGLRAQGVAAQARRRRHLVRGRVQVESWARVRATVRATVRAKVRAKDRAKVRATVRAKATCWRDLSTSKGLLTVPAATPATNPAPRLPPTRLPWPACPLPPGACAAAECAAPVCAAAARGGAWRCACISAKVAK